jgi:CubicO group peptidase (beta-lactamase class C family)
MEARLGRRLLALQVALCSTLPAPAAVAATAPAAERASKAADGLIGEVTSSRTPGCAIAASLRGETVLSRAYGMADLEHDVPNTSQTVFEAGSASKQFLSAAILLLAEEGKLALSDDIRKYLPEIPNYGATITIDHLLNHTSGLRDWRYLFGIAGAALGSRVHSNADALDIVSRQKALNHAPGSEFAYTNSGYTLAALIVERVSGQSLAQFSKERIFGPLQMASTHWRDDFRRIVKGRATAYQRSESGFRAAMPFEDAYGAGGLLTTVDDLLRWNAVLDEGRLGRSVTTRLQEQARLVGGKPVNYARGLFVERYRGVRELSHGGATLGYSAFIGRFPDHQLSVAILCNGDHVNANAVAHAVADELLPAGLPAMGTPELTSAEAAPAAKAVERWAPTPKELTSLAGRYANEETGAVFITAVENGKLVLRLERRPGEVSPLSPTVSDTFVFLGGSLKFHRADGGEGRGFDLNASRVRGLAFVKQDRPL